MGTWGPGLLDNDAAADWIDSLAQLGESDQFRVSVLNALLSPVGEDEEISLAAALLISTACRDDRSGETDLIRASISRWKYFPTDAERTSALDHARFSAQPNSRLWAKWTESADSGAEWLNNVRELVHQLEAAPSGMAITRPRSRKSESVRRPSPGDLYRLTLEDDRRAWLQYVCNLDSSPVLRVLNPGSSSGGHASLPSLDLESTLSTTLATNDELERSDELEFFGNLSVPETLRVQRALRIVVVKSERNPEGWYVKDVFNGQTFTSGEFRRDFPDLDPALLPTSEIPLELKSAVREALDVERP